ncbi:MAG: 16S rRNA (cytosine(967)-C(5))-methyltransferase RsmB [Gammaproteobacteria bacterium]|nr:16S rRNA (cytosine(967)-C(5))-methyltransferase RsmB [Gammaproteobacteria bacterium]MCW8839817.1 16S rRNA (cytosine(967)-C(5))-methyltransferase RsmB [Gammaproteobacteria bacterium]MCW8972137.1 16S rRNA (cytosine(967)-C(5))-methyltransferase RsmB [Gammaproteobacteria bacterium]MCW8992302.1 16S rRNA (cytosine(967)-C(5))-methyltransferase RsmB [Gammaproteobacteria bacterium]
MAKATGNPRATAVAILTRVVRDGQSLSALLPHSLDALPPERRALAQELCYGTLRWWPRLEVLLGQLMDKPLKAKEHEIRCLLLSGLYQLAYMDIPPHAAVSETVAVTALLKKGWAKGLVNAVLRRFQRERNTLEPQLEADEVAASAHPRWLLDLLQQAWPQEWPRIVAANNQRPPMTLRNNRSRQGREAYLQELRQAGLEAEASPHAPDALTLQRPVGVEQLPGFADGRVSIQDSAAQLAAILVAPETGMRVLDACAAPGGKTGHLLEICSDISLVAIDIEEKRLQRVAQNLHRLGVQATLLTADAATPDSWWDGEPFDRILLDAPCSATGVIRRHPDIKLLRRGEDIAQLTRLQQTILEALWPLLRPGGRLIYATCSVLPQENGQQLANFLARHDDAEEIPLQAEWGRAETVGRQVFPNQDGMDGFYYACLSKHR